MLSRHATLDEFLYMQGAFCPVRVRNEWVFFFINKNQLDNKKNVWKTVQVSTAMEGQINGNVMQKLFFVLFALRAYELIKWNKFIV